MFYRPLIFVALIILAANCARAQNRQPSNPLDSMGTDKGATPASRGERSPLGSPEEEMRARRDIAYTEKSRQENLERAHEAAQLSAELRNAFAANKFFNRLDLKKLDRLEKLARRIRGEAGGSDGDVTVEHAPRGVEPALEKLAEASKAMCKSVEKTPRQVISARVIERANEVLEFIGYVRNFIR